MWRHVGPSDLHSFPTRRSSDLFDGALDQRREILPAPRERQCLDEEAKPVADEHGFGERTRVSLWRTREMRGLLGRRSEEHTSELQSLRHLVCRLLLDTQELSVS